MPLSSITEPNGSVRKIPAFGLLRAVRKAVSMALMPGGHMGRTDARDQGFHALALAGRQQAGTKNNPAS
ncbi:MAG TPA: hypothetical protein VEB64_18650 [Azospirillaceae bacterium]|nr:hypothetical protein [Azospirillaceae bacterium]